MGARRLIALVRGLPPDSAFARAIDPESAVWSPTVDLLAGIAELVDYGNRMFFAANAKKDARQPEPIKILRPGAKEAEKPRPATQAEILAFYQRTRARGR